MNMAMRPFCFVLMPFGNKILDAGQTVHFDAVYQQVLAPAVAQSGLEGIRADEEQIGGTIHKPMFERLLLCEYAIADLTSANPNVYYELGIRHAVRPRSTLLIFAEGTSLPFDVAPLRGLPYRLDGAGRPAEVEAAVAIIATRLTAMRQDTGDDSPLFQLINDMPRREVDHEKTDLFRQRTEYSRSVRNRLAQARQAGVAAVREIEADLDSLTEVESGILVDLLLSYRDLRAYEEMVALYRRMSAPLQRARMMREQYGFALNRLSRHDEAEAVLQSVIADFGPSSETYGLLGRVYKDKWDAARKAGNRFRASGEHKRAVEAYFSGFQADWRDAYPGINALTLMELGDTPDPRQAEIAPVVRFAALQKARGASADYWDFATLLEVAVLARDSAAAEEALSSALPLVRAGWSAETTIRNLGLIADKRSSAGEDVSDINSYCKALLETGQP